ncbi:hypothetical protein HOD88_01485 [archaeon]|jgi:hypothetical protein|nr:hypothetical protein [archaeon]
MAKAKIRLKKHKHRAMIRRLKGGKKPMSEEQKLIRKNAREAQSAAAKAENAKKAAKTVTKTVNVVKKE